MFQNAWNLVCRGYLIPLETERRQNARTLSTGRLRSGTKAASESQVLRCSYSVGELAEKEKNVVVRDESAGYIDRSIED